MKTNSLKLAHIVAYTIAFFCFVALFFVDKWEADFHKVLTPNRFLYDFTLQQLILFILNFSLLCSIVQHLKREDERVQTIKNYVRVHSFFLVMFSIVLIGLISQLNFILLIWMSIVQLYYIAIFWICIYRDPAIIYLSDDQRKTLHIARNKKFKVNYISAVINGGGIGVLGANNRFDLIPMWIFASTYMFFFITSIYQHLKS